MNILSTVIIWRIGHWRKDIAKEEAAEFSLKNIKFTSHKEAAEFSLKNIKFTSPTPSSAFIFCLRSLVKVGAQDVQWLSLLTKPACG